MKTEVRILFGQIYTKLDPLKAGIQEKGWHELRNRGAMTFLEKKLQFINLKEFCL